MTFQERVVGVFKLDEATFEEVEHDPEALQQAAAVVAVAALLSALGESTTGSHILELVGTVAFFFVGWALWSGLTFFVGTRLYDGTASMGEMLRVIGFAFAPQALGVVPCLGTAIGFVWTCVAGFIAVRQGLDLDNTKTAVTIGIGAVLYGIIKLNLAILSGLTNALFSLFGG
jgi:hypothetical protein